MTDIVYVDNDPSEILQLATPGQEARIVPFQFTEDEDDDDDEAFKNAINASLWVFDYFLIDHPEHGGRSENGLSYFHKWRGAIPTGRPATAVVSGHLQSALGVPLGPPARYHVHATRLGVEWIGEKNAETVRRLIELADASSALGALLKAQPNDENAQNEYAAVELGFLCHDLLKAPPQASWARSVARQVDRARPPRIAAPHADHGAARLILGWLLHSVLPYGSFLMTARQAAVRLGITEQCFNDLVANGGLAEHLSTVEYDGPLAKFDGRRWWRAGIDNLVWRLTQQESGYKASFEQEVGAANVDWLPQSDPVIVSDPDLVETDVIAEASECVRAFDEDFPANADPAYVRIVDARENKKLAAKVVFEDRDLLEVDE